MFLHKLVDGAASRSYGIEVAKLAGLPPEVIRRATSLLRSLEAARRSGNAGAELASPGQLGLFVAEAVPAPLATPPVLEALRALDLNGLTPLDALNLLARWKESLRSEADGA